MTISDCSISCMKHKESHHCHAFNFREAYGSCQQIRKSKSHIVNSEGYQAFVQFLCLTDYPKIQNTEEAFHGWSGAYPAPRDGQVIFKCKHPRGFTDGHKVHMATCASMRPDAWYTTFADKRTTILCPPPLSCVSEHPKMENMAVKMTYKDWDGKYPAPPGATVIFRCPAKFNDESFVHNATCSFQSDHAWDISFQDEDVRCPTAVYPDCRLSESGNEYIGTMNVTETGRSCFRWDSEEVASSYYSVEAGFNEVLSFEEHFLNQDPSWHKNYCRNPTNMARPWCFVDDDGVKMEFCRIPLCDYLKCKMSQKGGEYMGVKDKTISGFACVPWLDLDGNEGDVMIRAREGSFPDEITESHNFCRNANGNPGGPWCNIKDSQNPNLKWEYCDIPFCDFDDSGGSSKSGDHESTGGIMQPNYKECRLTEMGKEYIGEENKTETGKECIAWTYATGEGFLLTSSIFSHLPFQDRQMPRPPYKIKDYLYSWIHLYSTTERSLKSNACRNYGSKERPWCFISLENPAWEYCDIPFCRDHKEPAECIFTAEGREYSGLKNVTKSGKKCQHWLSQTPNEHSTILHLPAFPDPGMDSHHNYCRNPDIRNSGPWCYNGEGTDPEWEYCDVHLC
ncbi:unnamed protein product [Darwinula stevensoni]|uniref:Kringle domain-containing protein n=1 Tax=Darwinula stevensoni TaxID=69355 RepID=A0A7R8X4K3_9CRUS|nr:unnamed protein product [Darwinula stevensoni]CAG0885699.1 unnamed protein product [Darwinula stevensoni]